MCFFSARVFRIFLALTGLVAVLIVGSHWFHFLVAPVLPLIFPGFFIFGEEWEPQLGVWGAMVVGWVISIPGTYILAWLLGSFILVPRHSAGNSHENT